MAKKPIIVNVMGDNDAEVWLSNEVVTQVAHQGECYPDAIYHVKNNLKELEKLSDEFIFKYLRVISWSEEELNDMSRLDKLARVVWVAANDVKEYKYQKIQRDNWAHLSAY